MQPKQTQRLIDELSAELARNHAKLTARAAAIDERLGLPSASSMHRAAACPGSVALEAQCPPEPPGPDAERGTRIHRWLSHQDVLLTQDEMETAIACVGMAADALRQWESLLCAAPTEIITKEERLWLGYDPPRGFDAREALACSGQPDIVYAQGNRALVIDFKTGFTEPDPAEVNMQLRTLAVLVAENSDGEIDEVTCCIIAPNVSREVSLVTYNADDLLTARSEILEVCEKTRDPNAPRIPGESQCKHCRGKLRCPELRAHLAMVRAHVTPADLLPEDLAKVLDIAAAAKHLIAAAEAEAKRRLAENPDSVPGWMLKDGAKVRHVEDVEGAYELSQRGAISHERFMECVEVNVGALEDAYVEAFQAVSPGITKKAACHGFNEAFAPYITLKQNAPSLKRVKEIME